MLRTFCAFVVLAAAAGLTGAADPTPPAGKWKLTVPVGGGDDVVLLISLAENNGKWNAEYLGSSQPLKGKPTITAVKVNGDAVNFALGFMGRELLSFDGRVSKDRSKLNGSLVIFGGRPRPTSLHPTKLTKLDDEFALARETLTQVGDGPEVFDLAFAVLGRAGANKLPVDAARGIVDRINKAAATYGPRWEREMALRLVEVLTAQTGLADLAVAQAKRAERLLTDDDATQTRMAVLEAIAGALAKAGKPDEAKPYLAQISKLELRDFVEYSKTHPPFKAETFAGRKAKSERAAVVEVFTGAECPPCVGVDLAFDGLLKTYKPTEAVFLQYHLHVPRPDPLTSPDANSRAAYYEIEGTPTLFINGKLGTGSGGGEVAAEKFYKQFRTTINDTLEKPATVKLALAVLKGEKGGYSAKASVSDLATPGEKVMLRFVLAEDRIRYAGGNGLRYHHMVVRAMPGGVKGFPLTKKSHEQVVNIDPDGLRATLTKYLDDFQKQEGPFPRSDRPLALRNLKLIALVQNDATREILNAVQIELDGK